MQQQQQQQQKGFEVFVEQHFLNFSHSSFCYSKRKQTRPDLNTNKATTTTTTTAKLGLAKLLFLII